MSSDREPNPLRPVYLLADSQLLFWQTADGLFLGSLREHLTAESPKAAYIGAANGDRPEYFEIFVAAMEGIGIHDCRMIPAEPSVEDTRYLATAELILLAGGDAKRGWDVLRANGWDALIKERYSEGALLIGVSAGALLLGKRTWYGQAPSDDTLFPTLKLVPLVVSVHEGAEWPNLHRAVELSGGTTQGVGIAAGGGLAFHPDFSLEPLRHPVCEILLHEDEMTETLLIPDERPKSMRRELVPTEIIPAPTTH